MRRFDKKKNMQKVNRLFEQRNKKKLINEQSEPTYGWAIKSMDDSGWPEELASGFKSYQEAERELLSYQNNWPNQEFFIEPADEPKEEYQHRSDKGGISGGIDGWEDMYPHDDY
jgi:hypothetical protein